MKSFYIIIGTVLAMSLACGGKSKSSSQDLTGDPGTENNSFADGGVVSTSGGTDPDQHGSNNTLQQDYGNVATDAGDNSTDASVDNTDASDASNPSDAGSADANTCPTFDTSDNDPTEPPDEDDIPDGSVCP